MRKIHFGIKAGSLVFIISLLGPYPVNALGPAQFASPTTVSPTIQIAGVSTYPTILDVNLDHKPDLVSIDKSIAPVGTGPGYISTRLGNGDGTFGSLMTTDVASGGPNIRNACCNLQVADFTGDSKPDAVLIRNSGAPENSSLGIFEVHAGNGDGTFSTTPLQSIAIPPSMQTIFITDIDVDGDLDLVASFSPAIVFINDGIGQFSTQNVSLVVAPDLSAWVFGVSDFSGDGKPDLLAGSDGHGYIWEGNGSGQFTKIGTSINGGAPSSSWSHPEVGDFTNDGKVDIVTISSSTNTGADLSAIRLRLNQGGGIFGGTIASARLAIGGRLMARDINHDGNLDLISRDSTITQASIYLGNGQGNLSGVQILNLGTNLNFTHGLGDINADGNPDLVIGNGSTTSINPVSPLLSLNLNLTADSAAPQVIGLSDQPPNDNDWYNTDVLINWLATDPLPSSGNPTQPTPTLATLEGTNTYTSGQSCDPAGNCATGNITLSIDKSNPTINGALSPLANSNGWFNQDVQASFSCNDTVSGIASCTSPVTLSTDGQGQSVTGTATDFADNTASTTLGGINIDKVLPTITYALDRVANAQSWYNQDVNVTFSCDDVLSGVASCQAPLAISTEGTNQTVIGNVSDNADNTNTVTTAPINLDKTLPNISSVLSALSNQNGWYNQDVTVSYVCSDALSGLLLCSLPVTISAEGASQMVVGTAFDNADNTQTTTTVLNIDKTNPFISFMLSSLPNQNDWYNQDVTASFNCIDALSGIANCSSPVTFTAEGANQSASGVAVDNASNTSSTSVSGINIDKTPGTVSNVVINPTLFTSISRNATVTANATDALSGIITGEVFIDTDPGVGNATPMTFNGSQLTANFTVDTYSILSNHTVYVRAMDRAGNWTTTATTTFFWLF